MLSAPYPVTKMYGTPRFDQQVCKRIDHLAIEIDVKDRGVDFVGFNCRDGIGAAAERPDHGAAQGGE